MSHKQRTLKAPVVFRGKGLHTGLDVTMTINPADSGCGIRFLQIQDASATLAIKMIMRGNVSVESI